MAVLAKAPFRTSFHWPSGSRNIVLLRGWRSPAIIALSCQRAIAERVYVLLVPLLIVVPAFVMTHIVTSDWSPPAALAMFTLVGLAAAVVSLYSWFPPLLIAVVVMAGAVAGRFGDSKHV